MCAENAVACALRIPYGRGVLYYVTAVDKGLTEKCPELAHDAVEDADALKIMLLVALACVVLMVSTRTV